MSKLFNVPPIKRKVAFYLGTYKGNRIVSKLIHLLEEFSVFDIKNAGSIDETRIFEISIFSDKDFTEILADLKSEFVYWIGSSFPNNYLFNFKDRQLGFVNSFNVFSDEGFHFEVCQKLKR